MTPSRTWSNSTFTLPVPTHFSSPIALTPPPTTTFQPPVGTSTTNYRAPLHPLPSSFPPWPMTQQPAMKTASAAFADLDTTGQEAAGTTGAAPMDM